MLPVHTNPFDREQVPSASHVAQPYSTHLGQQWSEFHPTQPHESAYLPSEVAMPPLPLPFSGEAPRLIELSSYDAELISEVDDPIGALCQRFEGFTTFPTMRGIPESPPTSRASHRPGSPKPDVESFVHLSDVRYADRTMTKDEDIVPSHRSASFDNDRFELISGSSIPRRHDRTFITNENILSSGMYSRRLGTTMSATERTGMDVDV